MSNRPLSMTPANVERRERRLAARFRDDEAKMRAEIGKFMDGGMTFNEAWVAAGGDIPIPLSVVGVG